MMLESTLPYNAIVENDGVVTLPEKLMRELGWMVGDDLVLENTGVGLSIRRLASRQQEA